MMLAIFLLTAFGSIIPWLARPIFRKPRLTTIVLNILTAFAAGVILGACFSHLLPDAIESWHTYFDDAGQAGLANADDVDYPFAELIMIATCLALLFVDKCLVSRGLHGHGGPGHSHMSVTLPEPAEHAHGHDHSHSHPHTPRGDIESCPVDNCDQKPLVDIEPAASHCDDVHCSETHCDEANCEATHCSSSSCTSSSCNTSSCDEMESRIKMEPIAGCTDDDKTCCTETSITESETGSEESQPPHPTTPEASGLGTTRGSRSQVGRAWVFFVALAIHSVFDGLGVGSEDERGRFYALLVAVLAHKLLDGFVLGISLYFANFRWWMTTIAIIFCACMTPLGIGIALAATSGLEGAPAQCVQAFFLSLSAGSFLFISAIELLPAALEDGRMPFTKLCACTLGWGIMALIALWV
eukprot:TRINITY_DN1441_c0_g2_i1.p1 TRINITY_DN1441_c0_g2~~TRINITY_DN1441_c0_g2_i1.p1  ORF type:complete len:412 (-),score=41.07 TRINITY_DN1441_c0_g2_i1:144-1379(-)